jgi:transposase
MDLHRRRSVLVRMTETGEQLETVRISNDPEYLRQVMTRAGEAPEVVLEATYGWYWAADTLAELGAQVHLAHPLGVKMFALRRVKNDQRDAADLADLLRMGRLPEAWIAPPATRELRGWVRHRAKLVGLRSNLKCQVHAVLAAAGVVVPMSDLFGSSGRQLLAATRLSVESRSRVDSLIRLITALDFEIDLYTRLVAGRLRTDPGYQAIQTIPGVGAVLGAVFVAEIGDITRFHRPAQLASWAGLTPKHHESDTTVHRGRITKQGSRWCAGLRSRPCNACPPTPGSDSAETGSRNDAAATSASWPPLGT